MHKEGWDMLGMYADCEDKLTAALEIFGQLSPEQQVEIVALTAALAEDREAFPSSAPAGAGV